MILERSKNAKRNSIWGMISNIISTLLPFIVRTVLIKELGVEYLGLSSLFSSILMVINITELGFGTAIVYSMYKPLSEDDTPLLCALLSYYKKIYRIIGIVILILGICLLPFLKYFISGTIPQNMNISYLYLLYLLNTVLSYWLYAYKNSILSIYQRIDIKSKIMIILSLFLYVGQIIIIKKTHNYYCYVTMLLGYTVLNNIIPAIVVYIKYPQYKCKGNISKEFKKDTRTRVFGLMITKLSTVSRNAFDSIIVSAFLGLTVVGIYNNYYYVISSVTAIMLVFTSAISAGIGNSVATDTPQKNLRDMNIINFLYMWIAGWCTACLVSLYQPFMQLWVGKQLMFSNSVMWMFSLYFLLMKVCDIQAQYFDATGLWWHRRWYSIIEAIANIILNFILGYFFGVSGIIMATILTIFFIHFLGASKIIFNHYFKKKYTIYIFQQIIYIAVSFIVALATSFICNFIKIGSTNSSMLFELLIKGFICIIIPNFLFMLIYCKMPIFKQATNWIKDRISII